MSRRRKNPFDRYQVALNDVLLDPLKTEIGNLEKTQGYQFRARDFRIYSPDVRDIQRMVKECSTSLRMSDITASQFCVSERVYCVRFNTQKRFSRVYTYCKHNNMRAIHEKESILKVIAEREQYTAQLAAEMAYESSRLKRLETVVVDVGAKETETESEEESDDEVDEYIEDLTSDDSEVESKVKNNSRRPRFGDCGKEQPSLIKKSIAKLEKKSQLPKLNRKKISN
jgi:hypothetical protein